MTGSDPVHTDARDAAAASPPAERRRAMLAELVQQAPLLVVLVLLWLMLWNSLAPVDVLTGIIVALAVTRVFELPPVQLSGRFNPWWLLVFLADFAMHVVAGSVQVAAQALRFGHTTRSAVVEVGLITRSDFVMTLTAIVTSLIPGSLVLEIDRSGSTLFLHVLGADSDAKIEAVRAGVLRSERMLLRALGSREEYTRATRATDSRSSVGEER